MIEDRADEDKPEAARDRLFIRLAGADLFDVPEEGQTEGEADGEEELRHDGVGIAAVGVVVLQQRVNGGETAQEVHQEHAGDRVTAELIEGMETWTLGVGHSPLG